MLELDYKESWAPKKCCFWTVVLKKTLESPLDCKEIQPVHPKGNQSWIFFGGTDVKAETPIVWPPDAKNWLIGRILSWEWSKAGGEGHDRGWDGWMTSPTQWTWIRINYKSWCWTGRPWCAAVHEVTKSWTRLSDWTELNWTALYLSFLDNVCSFTGRTVENSARLHTQTPQQLFPFKYD